MATRMIYPVDWVRAVIVSVVEVGGILGLRLRHCRARGGDFWERLCGHSLILAVRLLAMISSEAKMQTEGEWMAATTIVTQVETRAV